MQNGTGSDRLFDLGGAARKFNRTRHLLRYRHTIGCDPKDQLDKDRNLCQRGIMSRLVRSWVRQNLVVEHRVCYVMLARASPVPR